MYSFCFGFASARNTSEHLSDFLLARARENYRDLPRNTSHFRARHFRARSFPRRSESIRKMKESECVIECDMIVTREKIVYGKYFVFVFDESSVLAI